MTYAGRIILMRPEILQFNQVAAGFNLHRFILSRWIDPKPIFSAYYFSVSFLTFSNNTHKGLSIVPLILSTSSLLATAIKNEK